MCRVIFIFLLQRTFHSPFLFLNLFVGCLWMTSLLWLLKMSWYFIIYWCVLSNSIQWLLQSILLLKGRQKVRSILTIEHTPVRIDMARVHCLKDLVAGSYCLQGTGIPDLIDSMIKWIYNKIGFHLRNFNIHDRRRVLLGGVRLCCIKCLSNFKRNFNGEIRQLLWLFFHFFTLKQTDSFHLNLMHSLWFCSSILSSNIGWTFGVDLVETSQRPLLTFWGLFISYLFWKLLRFLIGWMKILICSLLVSFYQFAVF